MGSTGSIGVQALQVIAAQPGPDAWSGSPATGTSTLLLEQAVSLGVDDVAIADEAAAATRPAGALPGAARADAGAGAAARLVREVEADLVLNAIVGFAGLESTLAALEAGPPAGPGQQGEPGLRRAAW